MHAASSRPRRLARRRAGLALALALPLVLAALAGCGEGGKAGAGREYTVRGQVRQLPEGGNPGGGFVVAHEAIDGFVDREGKAVGMDPMTMPFPVAKGVALDGIEVNDVIEMTLRVDWSAEPAVQVVRVEKLPPGTKLVFRAARPGNAPGS